MKPLDILKISKGHNFLSKDVRSLFSCLKVFHKKKRLFSLIWLKESNCVLDFKTGFYTLL